MAEKKGKRKGRKRLTLEAAGLLLLENAYSEEITLLKWLIEDGKTRTERYLGMESTKKKFLDAEKNLKRFEFGLEVVQTPESLKEKAEMNKNLVECFKDIGRALKKADSRALKKWYKIATIIIVFDSNANAYRKYMVRRKMTQDPKEVSTGENARVMDYIIGERTDFKELYNILRIR